jgi:hypothetical protein
MARPNVCCPNTRTEAASKVPQKRELQFAIRAAMPCVRRSGYEIKYGSPRQADHHTPMPGDAPGAYRNTNDLG